MIKLLIVDDRDIFRDSLKVFLSKISEIGLINEVADGKEAIEAIKKEDFDVILMDIHMPFMNGIEATKNIKKTNPDLKILASSFDIMPDYIREILNAGALGFISKDAHASQFLQAIKVVANGREFLSNEITDLIFNKAHYF